MNKLPISIVAYTRARIFCFIFQQSVKSPLLKCSCARMKGEKKKESKMNLVSEASPRNN